MTGPPAALLVHLDVPATGWRRLPTVPAGELVTVTVTDDGLLAGTTTLTERGYEMLGVASAPAAEYGAYLLMSAELTRRRDWWAMLADVANAVLHLRHGPVGRAFGPIVRAHLGHGRHSAG